jgi:hypothetical protein
VIRDADMKWQCERTLGTIKIIRSDSGYHFLIDRRQPLKADDWDAAVAHAWARGWEIPDPELKHSVGKWEVWDLVPTLEAA